MLSPLLLGLLVCSELEAPQRQLLAIRGPLAPGQEQQLIRAVDFYGDFGRIAVAEGSAAQLRKLEALGFSVQPLGSWPGKARLVVLGTGQAAAFQSFPLFAFGDQELRVVPLAEALRHGEVLSGCHAHQIAPVLRRAALPTCFEAPPIGPGGSVHGSPETHSAITAADPRIVPWVAAVSGANIQATVTTLSSYFTRRSTSPQLLQSQVWLKAQLAAIPNLTVSEHLWDAGHAPNIVAELTGSNPGSVVVLGAHLDSINLSSSTATAPGADDNASGCGGLLEAARVLAGGDFENTIRCVWFSGEEFGLLGADAYAKKLLADGDQPLGMLNMDMISHRAAGDALDLDLATNNTDPGLTQFVRSIAETYVPNLPVVLGVLTAGSSDHAAFQSNGIPSAFLFEDLDSFSMVIHTANDTLASGSANDFVLAERIARTLVAAAAEIASPVDLTLAHAPLSDSSDASGPYLLALDVDSLTPASVAGVEVRWRVDGGAWQARPLYESANNGRWVGSLPAAGPVAGFEYYFLASDSAGAPEWLPKGLEPGSKSFQFSVGQFVSVFSEDFEGASDGGWTHTQIQTQDDWQRDVPQGKGGDPAVAFSGSRVWGNDLGITGFNGTYQPNVINRLESPALNLTGKANLRLRYRRWLTVEDGTFDQATILVAGVPVWQNPVGSGSDHLIDTSWQLHDVDVSAQADGKSGVRLRFQLESDGGLEFGGWNIDSLQLVEVGPGTTKDFSADQAHVSTGDGAEIQLLLDGGPAVAGRPYLIAIGQSGTQPGTLFDGQLLPLNADALTFAFLNLIGGPVAPGWLGAFSPQGTANAALNLPPLNPALIGSGLDLCWFTLLPTDRVSQPLHLEFTQ